MTGQVDFDKELFGKSFLTVSGQLNGEGSMPVRCAEISILLGRKSLPRGKIPTPAATRRSSLECWAEVAFADLEDNARLAEAMLKYVFKGGSGKSADDMKFFAERVDKDAIARLERFVSTSLRWITPMRSPFWNAVVKTFEKPVFWGVDLSLPVRALSGGRAFQSAGGGEKLSKEIKAFYMRLNEDKQNHWRPWMCFSAGNQRNHRWFQREEHVTRMVAGCPYGRNGAE
ncbi:hypothetical protein KCP78_03590 [Salmonella enterica subsp. enterica]|nr:hypothetical protein KCP78_03590 [Salmonella enterica subsp. enterica]